ncbi:thiamine diphosphokinase [Paenibacillus glucanolyticus]|uniref:thiamine diphosphokinase n=1 Tax=Paenibacillus TaxID=44249 RepID=UPI0003E250CC|nr:MULTISPECIES: thiamine diphosphokinase [Paenibacillus]ANA82215.1 thiamine pyrophosphokinase [Paenibacillus glucanolyticus]AVV59047.1 thiamine diphosphokinase [Paenibacillus glucanolyticus]AWP28214.1 thiamine pyrophosphokinase [Paenibacillus sp. Cedars]ETT41635.1 thiamine pyrophosphokinase [Paenibacillus sp. FSL R5-808]MPY16445.1 thiamine diphosphokinase [Paenibacillus glucanolyticus]
MKHTRVLIFTGGELSPRFLEEIQNGDFIIGADRGALYLIEHGIRPNLSVGDFDSIPPEQMERVRSMSEKVVDCDPIDKNLTDTELAFDLALDKSPESILILGATGSRLDHTLANIHMLIRGLQHHISCSILDENNFITLTGTSCIVENKGFTYVSLLPLTTEVTGIHLEGFEYPLHDATLRLGQSLGVSNKLAEDKGTVRIEGGLLLIIQSKDG